MYKILHWNGGSFNNIGQVKSLRKKEIVEYLEIEQDKLYFTRENYGYSIQQDQDISEYRYRTPYEIVRLDNNEFFVVRYELYDRFFRLMDCDSKGYCKSLGDEQPEDLSDSELKELSGKSDSRLLLNDVLYTIYLDGDFATITKHKGVTNFSDIGVPHCGIKNIYYGYHDSLPQFLEFARKHYLD